MSESVATNRSLKWRRVGTFWIGVPSNPLLTKEKKLPLAAFSLTGTLLWSNVGAYRVRGDHEWVLASNEVPSRLRDLEEKGWTVALFEETSPRGLSSLQKLCRRLCELIGNYFVVINVGPRETRRPSPLAITTLLNYVDKELSPHSFYCGSEVGKTSIYPWYRWSERDSLLAKTLHLELIEPRRLLGEIRSGEIPSRVSLIVTTGHENSGWEIGYEIARHQPVLADGRKLVPLRTMQVLPTVIDSTSVYIVYGTHPSYEERERIRSCFTLPVNAPESQVYWFSRPPSERTPHYPIFLREFEHPSRCGEGWVRAT